MAAVKSRFFPNLATENFPKMKLFLALVLPAATLFGQVPVPAPPQSQPILIWNATAHLGNGQVIQNSAIAFEKGKLTLVADATVIRLDRSKYAKIFDAAGKHVYPGFIAANTTLGLVEVDAARATHDDTEVGQINPNARSIVAYNTDSEVTPTVRSNGILLAQIVPDGGLISGTSSVVQLDAWNWEDAAFRTDDGLHLNWPAPPPARKPEGPRDPDQAEETPYDKALASLNQFFAEAKAYCAGANPEPKNQRFEAMRGVFSGEKNLYLHAGNARSIREAVLFSEKFGCHAVLVGGDDAWLLSDLLKQKNIPVILQRTQRLPAREDEAVDQPFKQATQLQAAGLLVALSNVGNWQKRNLPFQAGQAVGFGFEKEAAVAALTSVPAKILGIADRVGTLELGKDATLFISEGDALDMRTCQVTAAFIAGREINLDNRHKQLYRRFQEKYKAN